MFKPGDKFKPGDRVVCVDPVSHLIKGKIYTISECTGCYVTVTDGVWSSDGWLETRFEKLNREEKLKRILGV